MSISMSSASGAGMKCEFKTYHTCPKKGGGLVTEAKLEPFGKPHDDIDGHYALIIRRKFTDRQELESTTLRINSPHLLGVLRDVVGSSYTPVASDFKSPFELTGPFQMLMHYVSGLKLSLNCMKTYLWQWDELENVCKTTEDKHVRQHREYCERSNPSLAGLYISTDMSPVRLLFDFMNNELGPDRENVTNMIAKRQISYLQAWVLFRPGSLVYSSLMGHPWLLRCQKSAYEVSTTAGPYIVVTCSYTDHNGTLEGSADHKFFIYQKRWFGSENPALITDLPVYPRRFAETDGHLERRLEERGRRFLARKNICAQAYDGIAQYLKEPPGDYFHPDMADFEGVWLPFTVCIHNLPISGNLPSFVIPIS
jgi:hypothetical protein